MKYQIGKKNTLSLFLVLSMGMMLLPTTALAEDSIEDNGVGATVQEQDGAYENNAVAAFAADENTPTSGSCSDGYESGDLRWNYNKTTKTLTISGYGIMSDNYGSIGWTPFCSEIEKIVMEEGATWIGSNAFENMPNLTSVTLGKGLKEIHDGAFENDTALESIILPDSVTYIDTDAFKNCSKLKKIGMSPSLKYLCNSFSGTALEVLEVPSSVTEVRTNALENISGLKAVYAGSKAAAELCKKKLPNLAYCITDGGNLKANQTLTSTGFCEVERMGDILEGWYIGDNKATSLAAGNTYTAKWTADPNAVAEGDCSDKEKDNVTWKYERATKTLTIGGTGNMDHYTARWSVGPYVPYEKFKGEIEKIVVEDGVESIGNGAFSEMPKLKDVDLGKVKELGTYVFYGDSDYESRTGAISLESIVIPDTVTSIGICSFCDAINLKTVQMSHNLTYLGGYAFPGTKVEVLEIPASVTGMRTWGTPNTHAFEGAQNLKMVYAGSAKVLDLCQESRLNLIYAVTNGGYLVKGQDLTSTAFGKVEKDGYVLEGWYDNASFRGNPVSAPSAKGVYYAKWAIDTSASGECGDNASWSYKKSTKTLTISGSGAMADYENTDSVPWKESDIENVVISDKITHIGKNAFNGKNIGSIVLPSSVTSVGENAFANLPEKSVIYVNDDALFNAIDSSITKERTAVCNLDGAVLKDTELAAGVFGTPAKEGLAFAGWREVLKDGSLNFIGAKEPKAGEKYKALFCAKSGKCGENATWSYDEASGTLTISGTGRMYDYTEDGENHRPWEELSLIIKKGVIEDGITYVGSYAFANMTMELKEVKLGKDITEIGEKAFYCTRAVSNYTLPEGLTKIGKHAFSNTDSLDSIKLPSTLTEIGEQAFYAGHLYGIVVPKSVTTLADNTFELMYAYSNSNDAAVPVIYLESDTLMFTRTDAAVCRLNGGKMNKTVFEPNKLAVPTRAGYIFQGWYEADESGNATEIKADVPATNKVYIAKWIESDVTASANNYSGEYDGNEHSIEVIYPEDAGVTAVLYSTDGEAYSETNPAFKDVTNGAQTVYYRVMRGEVAVAEGSATVEITPCDIPVTLQANPSTLRNGGKVTLTIEIDSKAENGVTIKEVTCDKNGITVKKEDDRKYSVEIPAAPSGTYTFTAQADGEWIVNSKSKEVKAVVVNESGTPSHSGGHSSGSSSTSTVSTNKTSVSKTENGSVTANKANVKTGDTVVLTPKAEDGYQLDKIIVKDKNGKEITLTKQADGTYTFIMPEGGVDVESVFQKQTEAPIQKPAEAKKIVMQIGNKNVSVGNNAITNDVAPVIRNNRTMVPVRVIAEALGSKVSWNEATKEVTLLVDGKEIKMIINKIMEGYDVAPTIINDRTFVPIRFVANALGANITWDDATRTVAISVEQK